MFHIPNARALHLGACTTLPVRMSRVLLNMSGIYIHVPRLELQAAWVRPRAVRRERASPGWEPAVGRVVSVRRSVAKGRAREPRLQQE